MVKPCSDINEAFKHLTHLGFSKPQWNLDRLLSNTEIYSGKLSSSRWRQINLVNFLNRIPESTHSQIFTTLNV
jgi:hypothetical protein